MYKLFFNYLLSSIDPELIHTLVLKLAKNQLAAKILSPIHKYNHRKLHTTISQMEISNPIGLAAGSVGLEKGSK